MIPKMCFFFFYMLPSVFIEKIQLPSVLLVFYHTFEVYAFLICGKRMFVPLLLAIFLMIFNARTAADRSS